VIHTPVLVKEVIKYLRIRPEGVYVDATVGTGGHAKFILEKLKTGLFVGIDRDKYQLDITRNYLKAYKKKARFFQSNYTSLKELLKKLQIKFIDGILFDFGISSIQLETPSRGFSFQSDGPLDMRMGTTGKNTITAGDIINTYSRENLAEIFYKYGEEKYSRRIASGIVDYRSSKKIESTEELNRIIISAIPNNFYSVNISARIFQSLRIAVNDELDNISAGLNKAVGVLSKGGRIVAISFHSLEDRIVKNFFRNKKPELKILTAKPIVPAEEEIEKNPRSRSAKLRSAERL